MRFAGKGILPGVGQLFLILFGGTPQPGGADVAGDKAPAPKQRLDQPEKGVLHPPAGDKEAAKIPQVVERVGQRLPADLDAIRVPDALLQQRADRRQPRAEDAGAALGGGHGGIAGVPLVEGAVQRDLKVSVPAPAAVHLALLGHHRDIGVQGTVGGVVAQKAQHIAALQRTFGLLDQAVQKRAGGLLVHPPPEGGQVNPAVCAFAPNAVAKQHIRPVGPGGKGVGVGGGQPGHLGRGAGGAQVCISLGHGKGSFPVVFRSPPRPQTSRGVLYRFISKSKGGRLPFAAGAAFILHAF